MPFYRKRLKIHSIKGLVHIKRFWRQVQLPRHAYPYLVIHDQWTLNYYHWMTQALPRLLIVLNSSLRFTLILPANHNKPFHLGSLKIFGIEQWVSIEDAEAYYQLSEVIYPAHDIQVGDYNDDLMIELSEKLCGNGLEEREMNRNFIFVQRQSTIGRKIINEHEVSNLFLSRGFRIVDFESLSFEEQISEAMNCSVLAGVHGAGLTNMLFMKRGSKVLELTSMLQGEQYYYYTLSNALGHEYYYQLCSPQNHGQSIQDANIHVNISELNNIIDLMLNGHD
ncbi:MAG: glycosyltransferase family 61 protein [Chryseolinea sp.]